MQANAGPPAARRQAAVPFESLTFQQKYEEQTGIPWTSDLTTVAETYIELQNILATTAAAYKGSGRYVATDTVRVRFIKEVALQGLICGKDMPSSYDLEMLRYPVGKEINAEQAKAVKTWGDKKTARKETAATAETLQADMQRQTTILQYYCANGESIGGKASVLSGSAAVYRVDFGEKYLGKTLREITEAYNSGYVNWICKPTYIWHFPQRLDLFYGVHVYLAMYPSDTKLPDKAYEAFLSYLKDAVPSVFGNNQDVVDDDAQQLAGGEAGDDDDEPAANVTNQQHVPRRNQTNNVPKASIDYFLSVIKPSRTTDRSRLQQYYNVNPLICHKLQQTGEEWNVDGDVPPPV
jgi:hypothetical protein